MNTSLYISSGALQAFQQKLDTTSNNIANIDTDGFKRRDQSFSELLANKINNQGNVSQETGRLTPNGLRVSYGVKTGLTQLDTSQGQALKTDNPFDLMIQGNGFFQIGYPTTGGGTDVRYTRDGNFHLSPDVSNPGKFNLVNANGGFLLDQNGKPIQLSGQQGVQITGNGQIQVTNSYGRTTTSPQQVGIADIQNPHLLQDVGRNEYTLDTSVLAPGTNASNYVKMMPTGSVQIQSGYLEGSNVDLTKEMTDLMTSQRSYQMNARAVSYADQMLGIANNIMK